MYLCSEIDRIFNRVTLCLTRSTPKISISVAYLTGLLFVNAIFQPSPSLLTPQFWTACPPGISIIIAINRVDAPADGFSACTIDRILHWFAFKVAMQLRLKTC